GAAHSGWWDHIAPLLTQHRVVAIDLSGHGDSGWRSAYSWEQWADELTAIASHASLEEPVLVGHSMGAWVSMTAAVANPGFPRTVIAVDPPVPDRASRESWIENGRKPATVYPTFQEATARFKTVPMPREVIAYIGRHVAEESLHSVDDGWTWKFDPTMFFAENESTRRLIRDMTTPLILVTCEFGLVGEELAIGLASTRGRKEPRVDLPGAGHHPMLDQPLVLVAALRALLATQ
ncbi:MAG: alpha/beta hydrolase, partial [Chloroflexi bacterium]|nr:alpha/beta hydrolase [Chloroflexota bacterium]